MKLEEKAEKEVWSLSRWLDLESHTRRKALYASNEAAAWSVIARQARRVMRAYTTSFFIVSRFLPAAKRAEVEVVYAAVRYPDEIVDTFPLSSAEQLALLDRWQQQYEVALRCSSIKEALNREVPSFLAAFAIVVRERNIPRENYRSFIDAMRRDATPSVYRSVPHLIDDYIYGSAVVVGFFLTHIYGSRTKANFGRAMDSARALGIALQLTNFIRDVSEDQRRGRVYVPQELLREVGIVELNVHDLYQQAALAKVRLKMASIAESYYAEARNGIDAFSADCQLAIHACIKVYSRLNERIAANAIANHRESVPLKEKFEVLPASKYWRIPLAYLTR